MMYLIRKKAYQFNDSYIAYELEGEIEREFDNYEEAYNYWRTQEIAAFRDAALGYVQPVAFSSGQEVVAAREELDQYMKTHFDRSIYTIDDVGSKQMGLCYMPENATEEQIWEIRSISGIRFYSLLEYNDTPCFYMLEMRHPFDEEGIIAHNGVPIFFNSYEEVIKNLPYHLPRRFSIYGTPEELSDMPAVFKQLMDNTDIFSGFRGIDNEFSVELYYGNDFEISNTIMQLISTLKVNPLVIHKITLEEARAIKYPKL